MTRSLSGSFWFVTWVAFQFLFADDTHTHNRYDNTQCDYEKHTLGVVEQTGNVPLPAAHHFLSTITISGVQTSNTRSIFWTLVEKNAKTENISAHPKTDLASVQTGRDVGLIVLSPFCARMCVCVHEMFPAFC